MPFDPSNFTVASYPQEVVIYKDSFRFDERARSRHQLMEKYTHCRMMFDAGTGTVAMELLEGDVRDDSMVLKMEMKKFGRAEENVTVKAKQFMADIEYEPSNVMRAQYAIETADGKTFAVFRLPEYDEVDGHENDEDDELDDDDIVEVTSTGVDIGDTVAVQHEIEVYLSERTHATVAELVTHIVKSGARKATANDIRSALHKMDEVERMRGGFYKLRTGSVSGIVT